MKISLPAIIELAGDGGYSGFAALSNDSAALALSVCTFLHQTWNWSGAGWELTDDEKDDIDALVSKLEQELMLSAVGVIMPYVGLSVPSWALLCDGSEKLAVDYPELWDLMKFEWQASVDSFYLPDLVNRVPVGSGDEYDMAEKVGAMTHVMTVAQMPRHTHTYVLPGNFPLQPGPLAAVMVKIPWPNTTPNTSDTGNSEAFPLVQPSQGLKYIIVSGRST